MPTKVRFADGSSVIVSQGDKLVAKEFQNVRLEPAPSFARLTNERNDRVWINPVHVACFEAQDTVASSEY